MRFGRFFYFMFNSHKTKLASRDQHVVWRLSVVLPWASCVIRDVKGRYVQLGASFSLKLR